MKYSLTHWLRLLLLLPIVVDQSHAFFEWLPPASVCQSSHTPASVSGPAPRLPKLPRQYSMRVEANILQKGWTTEVEEHYDSINQRASVSLSSNGTTTISIFNFQTNERYDIYPNGTCNTRPSSIDYLGFVSMGKQNRTAMATVNEVFRFGTQFPYQYVGKESVRGIPVNHWTSCQEWSAIGAKFQLDYYFSVPDFITAAGQSEIPIRAVLNGSANNVGALSQHINGSHTFQHMYEFSSFRVGPALNEEVFQLPPGAVCQGRQNSKPLPALPDAFEMSMETVSPGTGLHPLQQYVRYDHNHRLVETWYRLVVPGGPDTPLITRDQLVTMSASTLEDFNTGLLHVVDRVKMTCAVTKLPPLRTQLGMAHGQNLLMLANGGVDAAATGSHHPSTFSYQGQTQVRQMLVDVWAMQADGLTFEVYFLPEVKAAPYPPLVGMFIKNRTAAATDQLPEIVREGFPPEVMKWPYAGPNLPVDAATSPAGPNIPMTGDQPVWGRQLERLLDQRLSEKTIHVFHYQPLLTDSTNFQVSLCYHDDQISQVMLIILTSYDTDVLRNFVAFSNSLRNALAQKVGVSVLQISNLVPLPIKYDHMHIDATKVTFTLLGAAPVEGIKQRDISELKQALEKAIQNGISFSVNYLSHSKDFMVNTEIYTIDYDKYFTSMTNMSLTNPPDMGPQQTGPISDSGGTKYSPGSVAGIAIATLVLGAVLCLGVVFLLYRRRLPNQQSIPYQLTS